MLNKFFKREVVKEPEPFVSPRMLAEHYTKLSTRCQLAAMKDIGPNAAMLLIASQRFAELAEVAWEHDREVIEA